MIYSDLLTTQKTDEFTTNVSQMGLGPVLPAANKLLTTSPGSSPNEALFDEQEQSENAMKSKVGGSSETSSSISTPTTTPYAPLVPVRVSVGKD